MSRLEGDREKQRQEGDYALDARMSAEPQSIRWFPWGLMRRRVVVVLVFIFYFLVLVWRVTEVVVMDGI